MTTPDEGTGVSLVGQYLAKARLHPASAFGGSDAIPVQLSHNLYEALSFKLPGEGALLIPTHTVGALLHLWKKAPKPPELEGMLDPARVATAKRLVRLEYSKERLAVSFGQVSLITVLTQGTFPNYRQLIPAEGTSSASFLAPDLERAARVVLPVAKEGSGIIRLSWGEKELRVEGRAEAVGTTTTVISAVCQGEGRIAFNYAYLLEYLKGKEGLVTLEGTGPSAPAKFSYRGTPHLVMMPMFIKGEGEGPAQTTAAEEPGEVEVESEAPEPEAAPEEEPTPAPEAPGPAKAKARRKKGKADPLGAVGGNPHRPSSLSPQPLAPDRASGATFCPVVSLPGTARAGPANWLWEAYPLSTLEETHQEWRPGSGNLALCCGA